jgi:hypothetical protein
MLAGGSVKLAQSTGCADAPLRPFDTNGNNVPFKIAVHDSEKHLEKKVDGVYQHREQV